MARKRTVLTPPPPPRARRAKPDLELKEVRALPGRRYRLRYTELNPFGEFDPPAYSDNLSYLGQLATEARTVGIECIIEELGRGLYTPLREGKPLTVADLAGLGLARQQTDGRWEISPEGYRRLYEDQVRP